MHHVTTHHQRHGGHGRRGPHGHGRGRGPGRARRGAVAVAVLALLDERPMHGYELIAELDERTGGRWRPSPGAIYPALGRMEAAGLVTAEDTESKRVFTITDAGRRHLAEHRAVAGGSPWDPSSVPHGGDLRRAVAELIGPARQIGRFGSEAQVQRATAVLNDASRRLYRILAGTDDGLDAAPGDDTEPGAAQ
jgi:DNA-binding PadR family transcriptional regulator